MQYNKYAIIKTKEEAHQCFKSCCIKKVEKTLWNKIFKYTNTDTELIYYLAKLLCNATDAAIAFAQFEKHYKKLDDVTIKLVTDLYPYAKKEYDFYDADTLKDCILNEFAFETTSQKDAKVILSFFNTVKLNYYENWLFKELLMTYGFSLSEQLMEAFGYKYKPYNMDILVTYKGLIKKGLLMEEPNKSVLSRKLKNTVLYNIPISYKDIRYKILGVELYFEKNHPEDYTENRSSYMEEFHCAQIVIRNQYDKDTLHCFFIFAQTYLEFEMYDDALKNLNKMLRCIKKLNYENHYNACFCYLTFALTYQLKGDLDKADYYLNLIINNLTNHLSAYNNPTIKEDNPLNINVDYCNQHYFNFMEKKFKSIFLGNQKLKFCFLLIDTFTSVCHGDYPYYDIENLKEYFDGHFSVDRKYAYFIQEFYAIGNVNDQCFDEALPYYKQAIQTVLNHFGDENLLYANFCNNYAYCLLKNENYEEAKQQYLISFETYHYLNISDYETLDFAYFGFAITLFYLNEKAAAKTNFKLFLSQTKDKILTKKHIYKYVEIQNYLAQIAFYDNKEKEGLAINKKTEQFIKLNYKFIRGLIPFHLDLLKDTYMVLANYYESKLDKKNCINTYKKIFVSVKRGFGPNYYIMPEVWKNYTNALIKFGDSEKAIQLKYNRLKQYAESSGYNSHYALQLYKEFIETLDQIKNYETAEIVERFYDKKLDNPYKTKEYKSAVNYKKFAIGSLEKLQERLNDKKWIDVIIRMDYNRTLEYANKSINLFKHLFGEDYKDLIELEHLKTEIESYHDKINWED